jgi:hypothetical protein
MGLRSFIFALSIFLPSGGAFAQSPSTGPGACSRSVPPPAMPRASGASEMVGVWLGELTANNSYQWEYYRCLGIVIESIGLDGTVAAKFAFGDTQKFSMQGSFAVKPTQGSWQGKVASNTLSLGDNLRNVRPVNGKRLEGNYVDKWGHGPVWFSRQ